MMNRSHPESYYIQDGVAKAKIFGSPLLVDEVDSTLTYIGYANIDKTTLIPEEMLLIKKVEDNGIGQITMSHAYGEWENRSTLTYIGY